jgi:hypothetical protein
MNMLESRRSGNALKRWLQTPDAPIREISLNYGEKRNRPYTPDEIRKMRVFFKAACMVELRRALLQRRSKSASWLYALLPSAIWYVAGEQLVASTNRKLTTGRAQGVVLDCGNEIIEIGGSGLTVTRFYGI